METTLITSWKQFSALESEWNTLLCSSRSNTIFLTWEWIQAWHRVVGDHLQPFVLAVRDPQGKLLGVAPYYKYRLKFLKHLPFKGLRSLADYATASEYPDWIVSTEQEEDTLHAIARALRQARGHWDVIWMPRMSGWSGAHERITRALDAAGLFHHSRPSPFSSISLPGSLQDFEASFSAKRRQQIRRNRRNLIEQPGIDVLHCRSREELPRFIESLFDLHHRRRMLLGDPGCFVRKPAEAEFYRQFLPVALDNGWLRLAALTQDDTIQAIQIGYAYNGEFMQMQEGFQPDFVQGAGNVLRHMVIEQCIEEGLHTYDFLGGYSEHKRRWKADERFGYDLMIGRPSLKTRMLFHKEIWPTGRYIQEQGLFDGK